ncbi:uncharacterized protein (TIGR00369 family) [Frondihabitans sp. PhB188]|uniref:PaaI family thioesterase n=1 Tax=Frondihabitans sp. PhB188 TaxID=2485200 RepID=UPI000F4AD4FC|nr:PaaI family thioesterase [Frondihabitans sp. PhB188]ROQ40120.1 uncharacterized protein (TIGR00369 family) [Frondihabitans sp. PhB188]
MTDSTAPPHGSDPARTKTLEWHDPAITAEAAKTMTGLDFLRAIISGELPPPPILSGFNATLAAADEGSVEFRCAPDESHYNPIGTVHGGYVCTMLDSALGCAAQSTLPAGTGYTSLEIKVSYLRPLFADSGQVTVTARVTKPGTRAAFAEGEVRDSDGKLIATATGTLLVFSV